MIETPATIHASPHLLEGLNDSQQQAVLVTGGPALVVAGPGSGKTRVLTHRIAHLIGDQHVPAHRIMAVTFTNKAAREMRDRIERLVGAEANQGLVMGTFHSFGVRLLRQNAAAVTDKLGILPRFSIYDDADQQNLAKQAILNNSLDPKNVAPRRMLHRISAAKSVLLTPVDVAQQVTTYDDEIVARVYKEYERLLRKANAVDFDDLLMLPIQLFDEAPEVLQRYQEQFLHVLVDEYQDTNRVQYVLVSALSGIHRNLFVVGDPDQSIYGWRQADIRNILDFENDFPDAQRIDLEINYRSTRHIVEVADRVIQENRQRIDRKLRTENDDGERVALRELSDQNHEAEFVVGEIRRLKQSHGLQAEDVAVMYRTTAQSRVLEEAFRTSEIPYRIVGGVRFYDRKEVKDVLAILRLLQNPADTLALRRVIDELPLGRGIGPKAMESLQTTATLAGTTLLELFVALATGEPVRIDPPLSNPASAASIKLGAAFRDLRDSAGHVPLSQLFDLVVDRTGYASTFDPTNPEEAERWANVLELRSDLEDYDDLAPAEALDAYLEQVSLVAAVDTMDDDPGGKVTLITLHSAKGLEFPLVFITGVEEGLLPISRAIEAESTDPNAIEEERRLFYVGITRAERMLYLTYTGSRMTYGRYQMNVPSRFLAAIPSGSMQNLGTRGGQRQPGQGRLTDRVRAYSSDNIAAGGPGSMPRKLTTYAAGQRVFHSKFGEGTIVEVAERNADQEVAIEFVRHGRKRLLASLAPLEVIEPA